jgi:hypothetical protein
MMSPGLASGALCEPLQTGRARLHRAIAILGAGIAGAGAAVDRLQSAVMEEAKARLKLT